LKAGVTYPDFNLGAEARTAAAEEEVKKLTERIPNILQDPSTFPISNVVEDANAALAHNISFASRVRQHFAKAVIELGRQKVKPDGKGGWTVKGMKTSLTVYQVLGAAWMRTRETGTDKPSGGLVADDMGFGKTMQLLACMVSNPSFQNAKAKGTLIVVPKALVGQWEAAVANSVNQKALGPVIIHYGKSKLQGPGAAAVLQTAGVILTIYTEVARSYPNFKPPKELIGIEKKLHWWEEYCSEERGILHQIAFYRVILDEPQQNKDHLSYASEACRGWVAKHRWAMSSTPIQDSVQEVRTLIK
jgi:SNF2 family DNA or RNA helicase